MRRAAPLSETLTPEQLAKRARLRYVNDDESGFSRQRNGKGFSYLTSRGQKVKDERTLDRIGHLAIPPAWKDVWICRFANGHLQSTGRDERKRKQYLYHQRWTEIANLAKFCHLEEFGRLLPKLRASVASTIRAKKTSRERVLAGIVALLDVTSIRVGNEEYVKENNSFGLTTLRDRHVCIKGKCLELRFRGKGGLHRQVTLDDPALSRFLVECRDVKGPRLFQYQDDDGLIHAVDSIAVNEYLREVSGREFTAKDFRTWKASALVAGHLFKSHNESKAQKAVVKEAICVAAETLANTATVCRSSYIHPGLLEAFEQGTYAGMFERFAPRRRKHFSANEQVLMRFLRRWKVPA